MKLPVRPPVAPMLAKVIPTIPPGASYEQNGTAFIHLVCQPNAAVNSPLQNKLPGKSDSIERLQLAEFEL